VAAITHIPSLADGEAADQIFFQGQNGNTAIMRACIRSTPLELVQLMITKAKLDLRKRCLLAIISSGTGLTVLHFAAACHSDLALQTTGYESTLLQIATLYNRSAAISSLLTDATDALAARDYAALAARIHGSAFSLRCLTSLLLCIKHGYVYVRRSKRHRTETVTLDTQLAFFMLNDNVWSHIMTFL